MEKYLIPMPQVPKIKGLERLVSQLRAKVVKARGKEMNGSVIVGYTAAYALFVHENIEMKWKGLPRKKPSKGRYWDPPGRGQSKFLEQPAREKRGEISKIVVQGAKRTGSILKGLLLGGLFLQRESQLRVPVDLGNLKGSAFTRVE